MPKPVVIIGAGPAGLTAAYQLAKHTPRVVVLEAAPAVGGMSRTLDLWGWRVDLGSHRFFSDDRRINELWLEVMGRDYTLVDRQSRILYNGKFFDYPLRALNALRNLGPMAAARCFASYAAEKFRPTPQDGSFEAWVTARFGRRLFEVFFKTYSEKLWGIACAELDADFAAQRIKKLSLSEAVKNALFRGKNTHKTLVDQFAYPNQGTGELYERMARFVRAQGGQVRLQTPVQRVLMRGKRAVGIELETGEVLEASHVLSTMPLTLMVERLPNVPAPVADACKSLRFRNTVLVYVEVGGNRWFSDQWLYIHSPELRLGRISNFRNWVPGLVGNPETTVLCLEFWCSGQDAEWAWANDQWARLAQRELLAIPAMQGVKVLRSHVHRLNRCYPVYDRGYKSRLRPIIDYLRTLEGLTPLGRYGAFKYNNQDHSLLMGMLAAENLLGGAHHDLWAINTDYEYQERALITASGLVRQ